MKPITRKQREAIFRKWNQDNNGMTYRAFRATVRRANYDDCLLLPWCNMWLGIEKDGYTHS